MSISLRRLLDAGPPPPAIELLDAAPSVRMAIFHDAPTAPAVRPAPHGLVAPARAGTAHDRCDP
ncbi:hypothetical protein [Thiohalocapsa sp. ML1]|jgi:hypothetical protein|uniref:hypothetical protein n=1 Tax=Thiohalocapsa sp. ML1 TaxID=1431688 RepID=UPI0007320C69|nr:hypothetical protein [Thiohalocapsa sp. ML1]